MKRSTTPRRANIAVPVTKKHHLLHGPQPLAPLPRGRSIWKIRANEPQYDLDPDHGRHARTGARRARHTSTIDFEKGVPVAVNGEKLGRRWNSSKSSTSWAARNGVGIADMVENRLVGMKSRGVYETPGGTILYAAHMNARRALPGPRYPALSRTQLAMRLCRAGLRRPVVHPAARGAVRLCRYARRRPSPAPSSVKLYKGNMHARGRQVPLFPVFDEEIATFGEDDGLQPEGCGRLHQPASACRSRSAPCCSRTAKSSNKPILSFIQTKCAGAGGAPIAPVSASQS